MYIKEKMPYRISKTVHSKQKFIWNMIGSMANAITSFVLLTCVTRISGSAQGGIFSLAYSTAQFLSSIGCFESRAIQATDVREDRDFKDYFTFRLITVFFMLLGSVIYVLWAGHTGEKAVVILVVCVFKEIDSISDSFQGLFQVKDRIDLSGMALGLRVICSAIGFIITLFFTESLILSSITLCLVSLVFIVCFDCRLAICFTNVGIRFRWSKLKSLFLDCLPLFIGSFMLSYIINAPKYAIDRYLTDEIQNYFGFLLMPAFVINLFSLFGFRPMLTTLAVCWEERKKKQFLGILWRSLIWILVLTFGAVVGAYWLGIPILNAFSGLNLDEYRWNLVLIMLGGCMNAFITVFYYVLTVMRRQFLVLVGYSIGFLSACILTPILVKNWGIHGASIAYGLPMMVITLIFAVMIIVILNKRKEM